MDTIVLCIDPPPPPTVLIDKRIPKVLESVSNLVTYYVVHWLGTIELEMTIIHISVWCTAIDSTDIDKHQI